jgi:hypothetical protein
LDEITRQNKEGKTMSDHGLAMAGLLFTQDQGGKT